MAIRRPVGHPARDLKLVVSRGGSGKPELYDLAADRAESQDLAAARPEQVAELQKLWDHWSSEQAPPSAPDESAESLQAEAQEEQRPQSGPQGSMSLGGRIKPRGLGLGAD